VKNGDTAILGGLIKEDDVETVVKVPLLGDIPILGWLFKSRSISKTKTNMVSFLTPKIIRNSGDVNEVVSKRLEERIEYIKGQGGKDPYGAKIDPIYRKAQGAAAPSEDVQE
jgi:general secretion pathway protein D